MAKINNKKRVYPLNKEPVTGEILPGLKVPKNMKPTRVAKPTDVGPNAMDTVEYALQKDVDTVDTELTNKINTVETHLDWLQRDFNAYTVNTNTYLESLLLKVEQLTNRFYTFVGLTVVVSIVINLYNWFS